jgi:hypothetical protein
MHSSLPLGGVAHDSGAIKGLAQADASRSIGGKARRRELRKSRPAPVIV